MTKKKKKEDEFRQMINGKWYSFNWGGECADCAFHKNITGRNECDNEKIPCISYERSDNRDGNWLKEPEEDPRSACGRTVDEMLESLDDGEQLQRLWNGEWGNTNVGDFSFLATFKIIPQQFRIRPPELCKHCGRDLSEPWKPKNGEDCFFVTFRTNEIDFIVNSFVFNGDRDFGINCFKAEPEAQELCDRLNEAIKTVLAKG